MRGILGLSPGHRPGDPSRVARVHRPTTTATLLVMAAVTLVVMAGLLLPVFKISSAVQP